MSEQASLNHIVFIDSAVPDTDVMPMDAFMQMADQINKVREAILQQASQDTPASGGKPIQ